MHDAEELVTMARWAGQARVRLPARHQRVPARVWRVLELEPGHAPLAIGLVGAVMALAAAAGAATDGRSRLYQAALLGFGAHGLTHLGLSAAYGGYTPGVASAPLALPFAALSWRALRRRGVAHDTADLAGYLVALTALVPAAHAAARRIMRAVRRSAGARPAR